MYDRQKYRKPLQHRQALFSRLSWYSWKILSKTNYTLWNEYGCISGYEFRYVVNQHSENNICMIFFNALSKFESQISSHRHDTETEFQSSGLFIVYVICCFDIRFNQMLFSFADNIIHEQIESVYFVYLESFC